MRPMPGLRQRHHLRARQRLAPDVRFSAGLAAAIPGAPWDRLLAAAERALYRAKSNGRGNFCCTAR